MSILQLILALVLIGIVAYLINRFLPMEGKLKEILNVVFIVIAVVLVIAWVLSLFGYASPVRIK